jgi:hypothetical protein
MDLHDGFRIVQAVLWYYHNVNPDDIVTDVYGHTIAPVYRQEKLRQFQRGLPEFWGELDIVHQYRLLKAAWERYGRPASQKRIIALKDEAMLKEVMALLEEPHAA